MIMNKHTHDPIFQYSANLFSGDEGSFIDQTVHTKVTCLVPGCPEDGKLEEFTVPEHLLMKTLHNPYDEENPQMIVRTTPFIPEACSIIGVNGEDFESPQEWTYKILDALGIKHSHIRLA